MLRWHRPARPLVALAWLAVLAGSGCARHERSRTALPDSTYIDVMARLSVLVTEIRARRRLLPDSVTRDARQAILRQHEVSEEALLAFAEAAGDEPERMEMLWASIDARADSLREAGWTPPGLSPDSSAAEEGRGEGTGGEGTGGEGTGGERSPGRTRGSGGGGSPDGGRSPGAS